MTGPGTFSMGSSGSVSVNSGAQVTFSQCGIAQGSLQASSGGACVYAAGTSFTGTTQLQGAGSHQVSGSITAAGAGSLQVGSGCTVDFQASSAFANTSFSNGQYHLVVGADSGAAAVVNVHGTSSSAVAMCGEHQINAQGQMVVQSGAKLVYNNAARVWGAGQLNVASTAAAEVQNNCEWHHAASNFDYNSALSVMGQGALKMAAGHTCTVSGGQVTAQVATAGAEAIHVGEDTAGAAQGTLNLQGHAQGPCGVHGGVVHIHSSGVVQHTAAAAAAAPHVIVDTDTEFRGEGRIATQAVVRAAAILKSNCAQHEVEAAGELRVASGGVVSVGAGRTLEVDQGKLTCEKGFVYGTETMLVGADTSTGLTNQATLNFKGTPAAPCHVSGHSVNVAANAVMHVAAGGAVVIDDVSECHGSGAGNIEGAVSVPSALIVNHGWAVASTGSLYTSGSAAASGAITAGKVVVGEGQQLAIAAGGSCGHTGAYAANQGTHEIGVQGGAASSLHFKSGSATSVISGGVYEIHDTSSMVVEAGANVEVKAESTVCGPIANGYHCVSGTASAGISGCYPACSPTSHCEAVSTSAVGGTLQVAGQLVAHSSLHCKTAASVSGALALDLANAHDFTDVSFASSAVFKVQSSTQSFVTAKASGTVQLAGSLVCAPPAGFSSTSKVALITCGKLQGSFSSHSVVGASSAVPVSAKPVVQGTDYSPCFVYDYNSNTLWYDPNAASQCAPAAAESASSSSSTVGVKTSWLWVIVAVVFVGLVALIAWLCMRKTNKPAADPLKQPLSPRRPSNPQSTAVGTTGANAV
jgi:hypothetical protein